MQRPGPWNADAVGGVVPCGWGGVGFGGDGFADGGEQVFRVVAARFHLVDRRFAAEEEDEAEQQ